MSFQLPDTLAIELLNRLGYDDAFRTTFAADPRAALAQLGFAPAADLTVAAGVWNCMRVDALASKEIIRASHSALHRQLTVAKAGANPITLEVRPPSRAAA